MSGFKDMLGDEPFQYPLRPGWRDPQTSREAAQKFASRAETLRVKVLDLLDQYPGGLTVHEAARLLDVTVPSIQPRFSELVKLGKIERTRERRRNDSGMSAAVWILRRLEAA